MDCRLFFLCRLIKKLLYCVLVPGSQPWLSELHSDTCCSLNTTEKGDHFNQDIKTGNEMDRGGTAGRGGGGGGESAPRSRMRRREERRGEERRGEERRGEERRLFPGIVPRCSVVSLTFAQLKIPQHSEVSMSLPCPPNISYQ